MEWSIQIFALGLRLNYWLIWIDRSIEYVLVCELSISNVI